MRNLSSGKWFVDNHHKNCPETLEELKIGVENGNTSFVNSLNYYNQCIIGSSPYWFKKRQELYAWVNHHVQIGNGAPTMFITLSCAEYMWADIIDKIKERMEIAGEDSSQGFVGSDKLCGFVNDYSIVVQEYFQQRVVAWLETVGKDVFNIKHYWVRYEFAPGRGQIHAHMLCIPADHVIYEQCYLDIKCENGLEKRNERLSKWAFEHLGLTASVCDGFDTIDVESNPPAALRFSELSELERKQDAD